MQVIFCSSPISANKPDELYEPEADVVRELGVGYGLIDFEALVEEGNASRAVRRIRTSGAPGDVAIFRGWMMTPANYGSLYASLKTVGVDLVNAPDEYKHCHYLPEWIEMFQDQTPESVWIEKENLEGGMDLVFEKLQTLGCHSCIVKDFVKSEKHKWNEACFIPDTSDRQHVQKIVSRFTELRGTKLEGGLVFRKFEQFKSLASHSKSGMPLTKEYRLFVLDGKIIHWLNYWEEGDYQREEPPLHLFETHAQKPRSRFFRMDIAETTDGRWLVVELGDGQVAGLPENADIRMFYTSLFAGLSQTSL